VAVQVELEPGVPAFVLNVDEFNAHHNLRLRQGRHGIAVHRFIR
jgi:hypothetical protein